jgi:hypothetical protein
MVTKQTPIEDVNAQIERELAAQVEREFEAEMNRKRFEIAARLRREAAGREYDRINARHPIEDKYGGLGPEGHAARLKEMDRRAAEDMASMDRSNARVPEGAAMRGRRASIGPGGEGFEIKRGGT